MSIGFSRASRPAIQPTLHTARLVLRPFVPGDAPAVRALAGAREVADGTLTVPHPYPEGAAEAWIATHGPQWEAGTAAIYAITTRDDPDGATVVGACGLGIVPQHAHAELGYWVGVSHWGRGYASEASAALVDFGFGVLELHRVQARHFVRNPASGAVMRRIGMRFEGISRGAFRKWDHFEDVAVYARLMTDE